MDTHVTKRVESHRPLSNYITARLETNYGLCGTLTSAAMSLESDYRWSGDR